MFRQCLRIALIGALGAAVSCSGGEPQAVLPPAAPAPVVSQTPSAAPSATVAAAPAESAVTVDADTPMTTPSGSTYTAPKGWTVTTRGSIVTLEDPRREVSVTFLERKE